ncbi:putative endo-1-3-(4)-beta-glucanase [Nymphaea thermarum]|nr:putative endo-1-3-(4)-beta-glucanase [Nymphaea thermarum]
MGSLSPFTITQSPVLPSPPPFFSDQLRSPPLPTNAFWQNYVLKNGDQPEYIHPYLVRSSNNSLSISYPSLLVTLSLISQLFLPDLTITATTAPQSASSPQHTITHFDETSVTLSIPGGLSFPLVRGSPYITCIASADAATGISISATNPILSFSSSGDSTSHTVELKNGQTWKLYTAPGVQFTANNATLFAPKFAGVLRLAVVPDKSYESVLDRYSAAYPVSGVATITKPFTIEYSWSKQGNGELLLLAHPLHRRLLANGTTILQEFRYQSVDGELVGVVGDAWTLGTGAIPISWHSKSGVANGSSPEIIAALQSDVAGLSTINTTSSYFYGKAIARAARLAMIAEELQVPGPIPTITQFLKNSITPWLNGNFQGNGFLYDSTWGGLTTKSGSVDSGADFGFGVYNDHHFHLGYFAYGCAVLTKLDPSWGKSFRPQIYALMDDYLSMNSSKTSTKLRNFDLWKLHSWAGGLTEFGDGRNQESSSEAIAAYYSGALVGKAFADQQLETVGSTLAAFEIQAAQTWWHVGDESMVYNTTFSSGNRVTGVLWSNKRESGLWFAPAERRECRLGIQLLPVLPVTETLFQDVKYVKQLVNWAMPALSRPGVEDGWKGFVYALQGVYDRGQALASIRSLKTHDDGNSLTNLLWWVYSR